MSEYFQEQASYVIIEGVQDQALSHLPYLGLVPAISHLVAQNQMFTGCENAFGLV